MRSTGGRRLRVGRAARAATADQHARPGQQRSDGKSAAAIALQLLTSISSLGTPAYRNSRLWPLKPFDYTLVYRVVGDELVVLAMAHQRRAAGYWRGRS